MTQTPISDGDSAAAKGCVVNEPTFAKGQAMSKFSESVQAWQGIFERHLDYRDQCVDFARKLLDAIEQEWNWPRELIAFYRMSLQEGVVETRVQIIRDAFQIEEDGTWFFGLELTTPSRHSDDPAVRCACVTLATLFYVGIKRTDDGMSVQLQRGGKPLVVDSVSNDCLANVLSSLSRHLETAMKTGFPDEGENRRRFGFAR